MPLYTYICKECGETFELLVGVTSEKKKPECKTCKSRNIERIIGKFSVGKSQGGSGSSCPSGTCPLG